MATHLDLEEQEQLDALKHFWNKWGNLITWVLIAVLGAYAAWNGWQYWQRRQAAMAAVLYDEIDRAAKAGDTTRVERALVDMKDKYGGTTYAAYASFPAQYTALAADRRGDVLLLQGKRSEAATEFGKAYQGLPAESGDYRRLVGMKLNALGIDPDAGAKAGVTS